MRIRKLIMPLRSSVVTDCVFAQRDDDSVFYFKELLYFLVIHFAKG